MKHSMREVKLHTATLSNGVTVTREDVAGLIYTCEVQLENAKTSLKCLCSQIDTERTTLSSLEQDLKELKELKF